MSTTRASWDQLLGTLESTLETSMLAHARKHLSLHTTGTFRPNKLPPLLEEGFVPIEERIEAAYLHASGQREYEHFEEDVDGMLLHFERIYPLLNYRLFVHVPKGPGELADRAIRVARALLALYESRERLSFGAIEPLPTHDPDIARATQAYTQHMYRAMFGMTVGLLGSIFGILVPFGLSSSVHVARATAALVLLVTIPLMGYHTRNFVKGYKPVQDDPILLFNVNMAHAYKTTPWPRPMP